MQTIPYLGGKTRIAKYLINNVGIPQHRAFVEPFSGMAALLLSRPIPSPIEAVSDLPRAYNVLKQLQTNVEAVISYLPLTMSEAVFNAADARKEADNYGSDIEKAADYLTTFYFGKYQSTAVRRSGYRTPITKRIWNDPIKIEQALLNRQASWEATPDKLRAVSNRLAKVELGQRDGLETMFMYDAPDTFQFIDPPYIKNTLKRQELYYEKVWTNNEHLDFLQRVIFLKSKVMVCGYDSPLYRHWLKAPTWRQIQVNQLDELGNDKPIYKHNSTSGEIEERKPPEYVWVNY